MTASKPHLKADRKEALRCEMRIELQEISAPQVTAVSKILVSEIQKSRRYLEAKNIAFYWAVDWEIDLSALLDFEQSLGKSFALPRWNSRLRDYEFASLNSVEQVVDGKFGIQEPAPECEVLEPREIDLALVPGLAFSPQGVRLGRGRGFYDRLLKPLRSEFWGVCHDTQVKNDIPSDSWDKPMQYIVTPRQWIETTSQ